MHKDKVAQKIENMNHIFQFKRLKVHVSTIVKYESFDLAKKRSSTKSKYIKLFLPKFIFTKHPYRTENMIES